MHQVLHKNSKELKLETIKKKMDLGELKSKQLYINLCSDDSDSDESYNLTDFQTPLLSENTEPFSTTSVFNVDKSPCTMINIEISEGSNISNNNLDFAQSIQEEDDIILSQSDDKCARKDTKHLNSQMKDFNNTNDIYERETTECLNVPMTGSSKNFKNNITHTLNKRIVEETDQICSLLPNYEYTTVLATLHKNCHAENRIELSLWDLLPYKRPVAKIPFKRKFVDDSSEENKYISSKVSSPKACASQGDVCIEESNTSSLGLEIDLCDEDVIMNDNNLPKKKNDKLKQQSRRDNLQFNSNGILRPAKLLTSHNSQHIEHITACNSYSILSPSKLTYVTAPQQGMYNNKKFTGNKNMSFGRNVFQSNSTSLTLQNNNSSTRHILHDYMEYLQFMQNVKKKRTSHKFENFKIRNNENIGNTNRVSKQSSNSFNHSPLLKIKRTSNIVANEAVAAETMSTEAVAAETMSTEAVAVEGMSTEAVAVEGMSTEAVLTDLASFNDLVPVIPSTTSRVDNNDASITAPFISSTNSNDVSVKIFDEPSTSTAVPNITQIEGKHEEINKQENIVLPPEYQEVYERIVTIFPTLDENHLKKICANTLTVIEIDKSNSLDLLQTLIEFILENIKSCPKKVQKKENYNKDKQYAYLLDIFPNADSMYLMKIVESLDDNESAIMNYIQSQCENPTYLTKEEQLRRMRISEQQKQYTSKFDVKQFLKIFPDPFKHFEDINRQCKYSPDAVNFLKYHYKKIKEQTLLTCYKSHKYHLTSTVKALKCLVSDENVIHSTQSWKQYLTEDIPLLQECAFITYQEQIREYMNKLKEEETREFEKLKRNNELLECQCCYNDECMSSKCSTCDDGHIFCNSCIIKGIESKLAMGETNISCFVECDGQFPLSTLQEVLSPIQFSALLAKKQEAEVMAASIEGLVSCPFCHFASIPPPEDKIFKCLNSECMKESCRSCKMLNHVPFKCYEKESDKARILLEEKMTEALVRKCYHCHRPYFKEDGCNKIRCSCGALMCYICNKPVISYSHFDNGVTRNSNLCPLNSDSRYINDAVVQAVAEKTIKRIKEEEPNAKLDTSHLVTHSSSSLTDRGLLDRVNEVVKFDT